MRTTVMQLLAELAASYIPENKLVLTAVHPWIVKVVELRNVVFMTEVRCICGIGDFNSFLDYTLGLPMMGWARHSQLLCQCVTAPPRASRPSSEQVLAGNAVVLTKAKPSCNPKQDAMSVEHTLDFTMAWIGYPVQIPAF